MIMYFASFFLRGSGERDSWNFGNTSFVSDKRLTRTSHILSIEAQMLEAMRRQRPDAQYDSLKIISFQELDADPEDDEAAHVKTWGPS